MEGVELNEGLLNDDLRSSKCASQQSIRYQITINNEEGDVVVEEDEAAILTPLLNEYFD